MPIDDVAQRQAEADRTERPLGEIRGINHLVLLTVDMDKTLDFYCGLLGMRVRASVAMDQAAAGIWRDSATAEEDIECKRLYFLEMPDGGLLAFAEVDKFDENDDYSAFDIWPEERPAEAGKRVTRKMDHIAFNVASVEDLKAVREKLISAGIACTPVQDLRSSPFVYSVYAHDPNGTPIEFAAFGWTNPEKWNDLTGSPWYTDPDPAPSFRGFDDTLVGDGPVPGKK
ncbi:VOC family protein [Streptomyces sp. NPDC005811]|uniref:VOC family protein n=1 Tax=Streptomyces sp. NPDC005811 TaxID=3154565 RepID=UPI0033F9D6B1